jgi:hypothetical protein
LVKYKVKEERWPHFMVANPRPFFVDVPAYMYFSSVETALCWITREKKTENDIYGVYKLEPVQITRMHMGSRRVTRDVPTEVEESVFEWVKQSE